MAHVNPSIVVNEPTSIDCITSQYLRVLLVPNNDIAVVRDLLRSKRLFQLLKRKREQDRQKIPKKKWKPNEIM